MSRTITSTVTHDLAEWSTAELELRYDTLAELVEPYGPADIDSYLRRLDSFLCGCGDDWPCDIDSTRAIDIELGSRAY